MTATTVLLALAVGTYLLKAAGPVALGGRELPPRVAAVVGALPAPLLAGLIATELFVADGGLVLDARLAGTAAAAVALALRANFVLVVVVAAVVTALVRLVA